MEDTILNALKSHPGQFVSGEELSRLLKVSRSAVWKEIEGLRAEGYRIHGEPHAGYRLVSSPDRLTEEELSWNLTTRRIGRKIYAYETTSSTMDVAHRLAAAGEPEGSVVVAEGQGKGRGRLGRAWISPQGKGIYASILLRPRVPLSQVPLITLMAAVAVARAVGSAAPLKPQIKWPNDLLVNGKKVAGILTEMNAELNRVNYVILGIGCNVNTPKSLLPARATSLAQELGTRVSRLEVARGFLLEMDRLYDRCLRQGFGEVLEEWRGLAGFLGRRIRVAVYDRVVDGQAVDVDQSGALLVRTDTGLVEAVSAGDVLVVR